MRIVPTASVMRIRIKDGRLLLLSRHPLCRIKGWCLPGGRRDEGETIEECIVREVFEETQIKTSNPKFIGNYPTHVNDKEIFVAVFEQTLDEEPKVVLSNEHVHFAWLNNDEINLLEMNGNLAGKTINAIKLT